MFVSRGYLFRVIYEECGGESDFYIVACGWVGEIRVSLRYDTWYFSNREGVSIECFMM